MAWNCGVDAVLSGRAPSVSYNYAERVSNLVQTLKEHVQPAVAEESRSTERREQLIIEERSDEQVRFRILQDTPRFVLAATE